MAEPELDVPLYELPRREALDVMRKQLSIAFMKAGNRDIASISRELRNILLEIEEIDGIKSEESKAVSEIDELTIRRQARLSAS